jgi:general secretion pathway protein D/MSHA biogenesis protein MshL
MGFVIVLSLMSAGCATHNGESGGDAAISSSSQTGDMNATAAADSYLVGARKRSHHNPRINYKTPVKWKPSYNLSAIKVNQDTSKEGSVLKVGADISSKGEKVPLNKIIYKLTKLKKINVTWNNDVDQTYLVNVSISAKDNFWDALDNILRQADYFYTFDEESNTIVIHYTLTERFYIANPFLIGGYNSNVGGDFMGSTSDSASSLHGRLQVTHSDQTFNLWDSIEKNLKNIIGVSISGISSYGGAASASGASSVSGSMQTPKNQQQTSKQASVQGNMSGDSLSASGAYDENSSKWASGSYYDRKKWYAKEEANSYRRRQAVLKKHTYYTIDKPLGIINVSGTKNMLKKIRLYIETLNQELSRQVVIEAKLLEVQLTDDSRKGIDWSSLLRDSKFNFEMAFGAANPAGQIYPTDGIKLLRSVTMGNKSLELVVNFLKDFGDVKVLSNPKLSLLNGEPGLITGGETQRIVDKVTSTITTGTTNTITYDIETRDILSGIGMSVVANIDSNDDITLHLTPVNTELQNPDNIEEKRFGSEATGFVMVQLPRVKLREMTTMAKVKSGQLLIIGGIISKEEGIEGNSVPLLGDIPYLGYAFKSERKFVIKKELVILLRPQIVKL